MSPGISTRTPPSTRKPGRGAYVCRSKECLKRAIKQKQLERAFECALGEEVSAQLMQELEALEGQE